MQYALGEPKRSSQLISPLFRGCFLPPSAARVRRGSASTLTTPRLERRRAGGTALEDDSPARLEKDCSSTDARRPGLGGCEPGLMLALEPLDLFGLEAIGLGLEELALLLDLGGVLRVSRTLRIERGELGEDVFSRFVARYHGLITSPLLVLNLTDLPLGRWMVQRPELRMDGRTL